MKTPKPYEVRKNGAVVALQICWRKSGDPLNRPSTAKVSVVNWSPADVAILRAEWAKELRIQFAAAAAESRSETRKLLAKLAKQREKVDGIIRAARDRRSVKKWSGKHLCAALRAKL